MTEETAAPGNRGQGVLILVVGAVVLFWFLFMRGDGDTATADPTPTATPTVEYMLAAIHGDLSSEAEFGRILDRIQAGGSTCAPESDRTHVGDVIVSSWENSGKSDTLLAWARALASICGP